MVFSSHLLGWKQLPPGILLLKKCVIREPIQKGLGTALVGLATTETLYIFVWVYLVMYVTRFHVVVLLPLQYFLFYYIKWSKSGNGRQ